MPRSLHRRLLHSAVLASLLFCAVASFHALVAVRLAGGMREVPSCPIQRRAECEVVRCSAPPPPVTLTARRFVADQAAVVTSPLTAGGPRDGAAQFWPSVDFWHRSTATIQLRI
jgi:hypothetical protein